MNNIVLQALRERRSIRRYKAEQITDEELTAVLEAGTWAPTAKGMQDPWIVAVQNPELLHRISEMNRFLLHSALRFRIKKAKKSSHYPMMLLIMMISRLRFRMP